ncbi:MAG TPA: MFS transporter [Pseudolabrys sp.]|nr:MFS transporter [Pseudolabrys sp.]
MPDTSLRGSPVRAIVFLAAAAFAAQAMVRVTDSLLPQIAADLNVSVGATSIVVTLYLLAHGLVQLVAGPVSDRFGKYLCATIAAAIATVMVALCGMASTLPLLVAARIGSGLATGWIIPLALAFVGDVIPYARRQQVLGSFLSGQILGQLFGQAMGGVLGDLFGWRKVFFLLAGLLALATLGLVIELWRNPITRAKNPQAGDHQGFVAGYAAVLRSPWARALIAIAFMEFGAMFGAFTFVGADLHLRFGVNFTLIGLFVSAFAVGGLIYSLSVRLFVSRMGQVGLAIGGGVVLAVAYVTLAVMPHPWIAPLAITASGLGFYMLHNTLQTNATQMTPEARGTALGAFSSALYLGQTAGVAAGAVVFDRFTAVPVFLTAGAILLVLGLGFGVALKRREKQVA